MKKFCFQKKRRTAIRIRDVSSQTPPKFSVDKNTQKPPIEFKENGALVTLSDIHDEFEKINSKEEPSLFKYRSITQIRSIKLTKQKYFGEYLTKSKEKSKSRGINVEALLRALGRIERLLSSKENLHLIHVFTCGRDLLTSGRKVSMSSTKARIEELWMFETGESKQFRINCVSFIISTPWLILCGCGNLNFGEKGVLAGWNVKRVTQPEIWIETPSSITAVSSCPHAPQYCAVAMLDGSLRVYELDSSNHSILLDTSGSADKHFAPVWWIEWRDSQVVNKSSGKGDVTGRSFKRLISSLKMSSAPQVGVAQVLVSASEDGTVKEWLFSKEEGLLTCSTLLRIYLPTWLSLEIAGKVRLPSKTKSSVVSPFDIQESFIPNSSSSPPSPSRKTSVPPLSKRRKIPNEENKRSAGNTSKKKEVIAPETKQAIRFEEISSFQLVPATCISFRPGSKTDYMLGTVAGEVLLCRTFDRDRIKQVYRGHSGQVSQVSWRPTGEDPTNIFLSASLDETIRIWNVSKPDTPLCILKLPKGEKGGGYLDTKWCPWYVNLVAGIHSEGIHLWDISLSSHSPVLSHSVPKATCAAFSPHTRNILVGDSEGSVHVIHLEGLKESPCLFFKYASGLSKLAKLSISEQ